MILKTLRWATPDKETARRAYEKIITSPLVSYVRIWPLAQEIWLAPSFFNSEKGMSATHTDIVQIGLVEENVENFLKWMSEISFEITRDHERWALVFEEFVSPVNIHILTLLN